MLKHKKLTRRFIYIDGIKLSIKFTKKLTRTGYSLKWYAKESKRCFCEHCEWGFLDRTDRC